MGRKMFPKLKSRYNLGLSIEYSNPFFRVWNFSIYSRKHGVTTSNIVQYVECIVKLIEQAYSGHRAM